LNFERLKKVLPSAIPVRLVRDPVDNALSILNCMTQGTKWFSVYPKECSNYEKSNRLERVAAQVYWLNKRLDNSVNDEGVVIHYEELCKSPDETLQKVALACKSFGWKVEAERLLPETFKIKPSAKSEGSDSKMLHVLIKQLESTHGQLKYNSLLNK
jgi:hypothetical protein